MTKLANMHYPGMRADPNELKDGAQAPLDEALKKKFADQIACIGEDAQRALLAGSAIVVGATGFGMRVAKRLVHVGVGRIGIFEPSLSLDLAAETADALSDFSKWAAAEAPWGQYESFRGRSIDRQLDDIARGFNVIISSLELVGETLEAANQHGLSVLVADVSGFKAWHARLNSICADCVCLPGVDLNAGGYHISSDIVCSRVVDSAARAILTGDLKSSELETIDCSPTSGLTVERAPIRPRAGCPRCKP